MRTISTLIIKPTKGCNADCSYCSAPPDGAPKWSIDDFKNVFEALEPKLHPHATFIWHGGEPMLLGPDFYEEAYAIATATHPHIKFSLQSNLLGYNKRWKTVFDTVFKGSLSTSWDPDGRFRTLKGSTELYERIYQDRIGKILTDGYRPKVISTFDEYAAPLMHRVYELALESDKKGLTHDIRLNYRYPAGRAQGEGETLTPGTYGKTLLEIYERWLTDTPGFLVTPLDQMFLKVTGRELARCPWAKACTGRIVGIEPNYDVYNCGEFADLADPQFCFGNLLEDGIEKCLSSPAAKMLAARTFKTPKSCQTCIHFEECEGGCMRDSALYGRGIYGKFHYCESWQEVFSRVKESILTGEADNLIRKFGQNPTEIRARVAQGLKRGIQEGKTNMRRPVLTLGHIPAFPEDLYMPDLS